MSGRGYAKKPPRAGTHPVIAMIDHERCKQGLTIKQLMAESGLTENVLDNWKAGQNPQYEHIEAVLRRLGFVIKIEPE